MRLKEMNKSLIGIMVAMAAVSCSDELVNNDGLRPAGGEYSEDISFVVTDNTSATRGGSAESRRCGGVYLLNDTHTDSLYMQMEVSDIDTPLSTRGKELTMGTIADISMTCRMRTSGSNYNHYFADLTFSKSGETTDNGTYIWKSTPDYYWLDANTHFNFYGYAPAAANGVTFHSNSDSNFIPTLDYEVPGTASEQKDLVYHDQSINTSNYDNTTGYDFEYIANAKQVVPLNMKHALAKVAFKTGAKMAAGTIKSVTIKKVYDKGTLDLSTGKWDIDKTSTKDFSIEKEVSDCDKEINSNDDGTYFFLLPESAKDDTFVEIIFYDGNKDIQYTAPLVYTWEAGKSYVYTIKIDPELEIDLVPETQDAHYVIAKAHIKASGMPGMREGQQWELSVSASDGADVTVVDELNNYNKDGYWTDKKITRTYNKDNILVSTNIEPARGQSVITGTGDKYVYVFIPENTTNEERIITMDLRIKEGTTVLNSKTFKQTHPEWVENSNFGWENKEEYTEWEIGTNGEWSQKIGNPEAPWGYMWSRTVVYQRNDISWNLLVYTPMVRNLVEQYNASSYTVVDPGGIYGFLGQVKITINYKDLNNLSNISLSESDGLNNSRNLFNYSGGAVTGALEEAIKAIDGMELKSDNSNNEFESVIIALGIALKKNKYDWIININKDDEGNEDLSNSISIERNDITWFLPAYEQFSNGPSTYPLNGIYWSSSPDGNKNAKANNASYSRKEYHKIRACRMKP